MHNNLISRYLAGLFIITCVMGLSACTSASAKRPSHKELTPAEASELIRTLTGLIIIDVRTPGEYNDGHIEGAINIDSAGANYDKNIRSLDKSLPYLVYCRSGNRSKSALKIMADAGFEHVYHLTEGYRAFILHKE